MAHISNIDDGAVMRLLSDLGVVTTDRPALYPDVDIDLDDGETRIEFRVVLSDAELKQIVRELI